MSIRDASKWAARAALVLAATAWAAPASYMSNVTMQAQPGPGMATTRGGADGVRCCDAFIVRMGESIKLQINFHIGWVKFNAQGQEVKEKFKDAVPNPEYTTFGDDWPAWLQTDKATGIVQGTPYSTGKWLIYPAVRDINTGEDPYRGQGFWWTEYTKSNSSGKTYIKVKDPVAIVVLPARTGREISLRCKSADNRERLLELDYDNRHVLVTDGEYTSVYSITLADTMVTWKDGFGTHRSLDRTNGEYREDDANFPYRATCEKRSTEVKF